MNERRGDWWTRPPGGYAVPIHVIHQRDEAAQELRDVARKCRDLGVPTRQVFEFLLMGLRGLSLTGRKERDHAAVMAALEDNRDRYPWEGCGHPAHGTDGHECGPFLTEKGEGR